MIEPVAGVWRAKFDDGQLYYIAALDEMDAKVGALVRVQQTRGEHTKPDLVRLDYAAPIDYLMRNLLDDIDQ